MGGGGGAGWQPADSGDPGLPVCLCFSLSSLLHSCQFVYTEPVQTGCSVNEGSIGGRQADPDLVLLILSVARPHQEPLKGSEPQVGVWVPEAWLLGQSPPLAPWPPPTACEHPG